MSSPIAAPGSQLVRDLTPAEAALLEGVADRIQTDAEQAIFTLGQEARTLYVLRAGRLALSMPIEIRGESRNVTVQEVDPGSLIGWSSLVPPHQYTLSARMLGKGELLAFSREALDGLFVRNHHLWAVVMTNVARVIGARLNQLQAILLRDMQRWIAGRDGA